MPGNDPERGKWTFREWHEMAQALGTEPLLFRRVAVRRQEQRPATMAADAPPPKTLTDTMPVAPPPVVALSDRHLEYVLTWWGIAAASLALGFLKR